MIIWFNKLSDRNGISVNYSPKEIVTGKHLDFKKQCNVVFGSYVEAYYETTTTNNMDPITHDSIALTPIRNLQVTQKFFCLYTGRVLKRRSIIPVVAPYQIIRKVNDLVFQTC